MVREAKSQKIRLILKGKNISFSASATLYYFLYFMFASAIIKNELTTY